MAICLKCGESDNKHEIEMPSKLYETKNGKRVEVCDGFQAYKNQPLATNTIESTIVAR